MEQIKYIQTNGRYSWIFLNVWNWIWIKSLNDKETYYIEFFKKLRASNLVLRVHKRLTNIW